MGCEITVVDHSKVSGWLRAVFSFGCVDMKNVKSMVKGVIFATKLEERIDRLNIVDHGDEDGMQIGGDYVSDMNLSEFSEDLRRLAFFMATGSGKTLVLHANLWQMLHYLEHGKHPEALVNRADHRREFDNVLLITPREELSLQHLEEFRRSGIDAALLIQDRTGPV